MKNFFPLLIAFAVIALSVSCERDGLTGEALAGDQLATRDGHIPDVLCPDVCEDLFFGFEELPADQPFPDDYFGATITAVDHNGNPAEVWVFDTDRTAKEAKECAEFNDIDLLFPDGPFGNVLVIQEAGVTTCANDAQRGGTVLVDLRAVGLSTINCITFFDTEEEGIDPSDGSIFSGLIAFGDEDGNLIAFEEIPGVEDGGAAIIEPNQSGVAFMEFIFLGSGAVSGICLSVDQPACPEEASVLDFEGLAENTPVNSVNGVAIDAYPTPAIAFNTASPTMCPDFDDDDMLFNAPIPGLSPGFEFGNVLVNQHQTKTGCANADPRGGTIAFTFPYLSSVSSMAFQDTEESGYVTFYGPGDTYLTTLPIPVTPDGGFAYLTAGVDGVAKMVVDFNGSGGIDEICYVESDVVNEPVEFTGCTAPKQWWRYNLDMVCEIVDLEEENGCGQTIPIVLATKIKGNSYRLLNKEYVTAFLNVACGGAPFDGLIAETWMAAGTLLQNCDQEIPEESMPILLQLQHFNEGVIGPGSCDEEDMVEPG